MAALTYQQAGVDRDKADALVGRIEKLARGTLGGAIRKRVKSSIGGYASLFEMDRARWLAASTDGVGTKLKLAFRTGVHDTVGVDLVAMSVNDLLCVGARPLFFLDYFATGRLDSGVAEAVIAGVSQGCQQAGCALVGGETAEMPDLYQEGEYDLGGFAVGEVRAKDVLPRKDIRAGDALIGIASSGFHSNGYSLIRRWIPEGAEGDARAREWLTPTRIYCREMLPLFEKKLVLGAAHITGSGFLNVPRMSSKVSYRISLPALTERAAPYQWVYRNSGLDLTELSQTFNLGIGMVLAVRGKNADATLARLKRSGAKAWLLGECVRAKGGCTVEIADAERGETARLSY